MKGQIPPELVKEAKGGEVHVDMEDHRDEEFVKPKVSARPFQGAGNNSNQVYCIVKRDCPLQVTCLAPSPPQLLPPWQVPAWTPLLLRRPPGRSLS